MGRRGPRPTPTKTLDRRGSWRGKARRAKGEEPEPVLGLPERPEWLLPVAAAEWDRVAPELLRLELLAVVDWSQFAAYCQSYAHWVAAEEFMAKHGTVMTIRDDKGNVKFSAPVPQWGIAQKALEKLRAFAREFGLSPAARVGLTKPEGNGDDAAAAELAAVLGGAPPGVTPVDPPPSARPGPRKKVTRKR